MPLDKQVVPRGKQLRVSTAVNNNLIDDEDQNSNNNQNNSNSSSSSSSNSSSSISSSSSSSSSSNSSPENSPDHASNKNQSVYYALKENNDFIKTKYLREEDTGLSVVLDDDRGKYNFI